MKVARDERLTNPAHGQLLPPSWRTLYELTKLTDEEFQARLAARDIKPDLERNEIATWRRVASREADQIRVSNLTPIEGRKRTLVPVKSSGDMAFKRTFIPMLKGTQKGHQFRPWSATS